MICRLYDTKEKRYIKTDEMDYMVHQSGAAFHLGAEDHRVETELSTQKLDINGVEVFENDVIANEAGNVLGTVKYIPRAGMFGVFIGEAPHTNYRSRIKNLRGFGRIQVVGNIRDEEMEAE